MPTRSRLPVFAANWKMNLGPREARSVMARFLAAYPPRTDRQVIVCPPALSLEAVAQSLGNRADVSAGVQNVWTEARGAFTGESSAPMAREAGARYALVGHSERRHVFGETNEQTAAKCAIAVENELIPILCVGETLAQRDAGRTTDIVVEQLHAGLGRLAPRHIVSMLIAYEPVWAIGTGKTATPGDASAVHQTIRSTLAELVADTGEEPVRAHRRIAGIPILYGGSVNAANAAALLGADQVDGVLVGGASLDPAVWAEICNTVLDTQSQA